MARQEARRSNRSRPALIQPFDTDGIRRLSAPPQLPLPPVAGPFCADAWRRRELRGAAAGRGGRRLQPRRDCRAAGSSAVSAEAAERAAVAGRGRGRPGRGCAPPCSRCEDLAPGPVLLGGQSYGGRQATLLAADQPALVDVLVCFSYPLHPPGKPEQLWHRAFSASL